MIEIKDKSACCGCSACVQVCPKDCILFNEDNEGFRYPSVDSTKCIDCGLCEKACPVITQNEPRQPIGVYAAKNGNEDVRLSSSSGGIFTALAEIVINRGGVVFGARFDENWEVKHDFTETIEGLSAFRGSKYLQSRIENAYSDVETFLKQDRTVLFSGTPCQVAGLKRYLRREYENLLTTDFVCHGVPSPLVWREYLERASKGRIISNVNFRNKTESWKKYKFVVEGKNAIVNQTFFSNEYMQGFLRDIYLRPSCYACPAKSSKSGADITLGDFWGIENYLPEFDDDKGVSLVMVQTEKGATYFNAVKCRRIDTDYERALDGNPSIEKNAYCSLKYRQMFWQSKDKINNISRIISKMKPSFLRRCIGFAKRIIRKLVLR